MLSTGEEIKSPQRSSSSGPILAKMPCTKVGLSYLGTPNNRITGSTAEYSLDGLFNVGSHFVL